MSARVPEPPAPEATEPEAETASRSVDPTAIEQLLDAPAYAAPQRRSQPLTGSGNFTSQRIVTDQVTYRGKRISLNLVDADIKQVFRLFHEISGLNFVLDPDVGHHSQEQRPGQGAGEQRSSHRDDRQVGVRGRVAQATERGRGTRSRANHVDPHAVLRHVAGSRAGHP
jgi:hypothetical protein